MSQHITFIIARRLLEARQSEVTASVKPRKQGMSQLEYAKRYKSELKELQAIEDELNLLNNW